MFHIFLILPPGDCAQPQHVNDCLQRLMQHPWCSWINLCQLLKTLKTPRFLLWTFEQVFSTSFLFMQLQVHSIQRSRLSLNIQRGRNTRVMWVEVKHSSMDTERASERADHHQQQKCTCISTLHSTFQHRIIRTMFLCYGALCAAALKTNEVELKLPSKAGLEWIAKYFEHYTITKNHRNVFITRRGFRSTLCTCIYNTQHLFPELKHSNNMCSWSTHTNTHTHIAVTGKRYVSGFRSTSSTFPDFINRGLK